MTRIVTMGAADDGLVVNGHVGDTFVVNIDESPTTGFRWEHQPIESGILDLAGDSFELAAEPMVGSGGTRQFSFVARSAGQATIALQLRRSWEIDKPPLRTFTVRVMVA